MTHSTDATDPVDQHFAELVQTLEAIDLAVDQMTNVLPQEKRELFLRLLVALDVKENSPLLPLFVGLQIYQEYLKAVARDLRSVAASMLDTLPEKVKTAADTATTRAITGYGKVQTQIDSSVGAIEKSVKAGAKSIDDIRGKWKDDTSSLIAEIKTAVEEAAKASVKKYQADIAAFEAQSKASFKSDWHSTRDLYLSDVRKQGLLYTTGAIIAGILLTGVGAGYVGYRMGHDRAIQETYSAFGNQYTYNYAKRLVFLKDNRGRLIRCEESGNSKCTIWLP